MATIKIVDFTQRQFGPSPYGNQAVLTFPFVATAAGVVSNSNSTAAAAVGDVVDLGELPAGFRMDDSLVVVSDAFTTGVTAKLGFAYEDGVDDATVPQDDDYFGAGLVLDATARLRNVTANQPVNLPKPARLILTLAGAALAQAGRADIVITGELTGAK
jgi:hypothetical protein